MTLPQFFRNDRERAIVSFNFLDIADGTGIVEFNMMTSKIADALNFNLNKAVMEVGNTDPTTVTSHERRTFFNAAEQNRIFELSTFNTTKTIRGDCFINFTLVATSSNTGTTVFTISLLKNGSTITSTTATTTKTETMNILLDIPRTNFKSGDVMAIKIELTSETGVGSYFLLHDPKNRDITGYTPSGGVGTFPTITASDNPTEGKVFIAFEIDI